MDEKEKDLNNPPEGQGGGNENKNNNQGDDKKTPENVPYSRFVEVNKAKKDAEKLLSEYQKKEKEALEAKKKEEEAEALKKGEHEKLLEQKDQELNGYKSKEEKWSKREEHMKTSNDSLIASLKEKHGEEKWKTAESLITGIDDPFDLAVKLQTVETLLGNSTPPQGGSNVPDGSGGSKLDEYKAKLEKGERLSASEQSDYIKLLAELD